MKNLLIIAVFIFFSLPTLTAQPVAMFILDLDDFCDSSVIRVIDLSYGAEEWEYIFHHTETISSKLNEPEFKVNGYHDDIVMTVTQIVKNQNGTDTLVWYGNPPYHFNEQIVYYHEFLSFKFLPSNGGYSNQYIWDFGDGNTSTKKEAIHQYSAPGNYEVSLRAVGADVCDEPIVYRNVTATAIPEVNFQSNSTAVCAGNTVEFDEITNFADSVTWYFENGMPAISTENDPTVTYQSGGDFDVMLIANNEYYTDTLLLEDYIQVIDIPLSEFYYQVVGKEVSFNNESSWATEYFWTFDDGNTSTEVAPSHTYEETGTFHVTLIATNMCGKDTASYFVHIQNTTAVSYAKENPFKVLPNPFSSELQLNWQRYYPEEGIIQLVDITGRTIWENPLMAGLNQNYLISTAQLQQGLYILNIKTQDSFYSERVYHIK